MPDNELKAIYRNRKARKAAYAAVAVPVLFLALFNYGIYGWATFASSLSVQFRHVSNDTAGVLYYVAFFIACCFISIADSKTLWHMLVPVPVFSVLIFAIFMYFSIEPLVMELVLAVFYLRLRRLISDIEFLKGLPSYPFEGHRDYSQMNAMSQADQLKELENALNGARSEGYEHIFTDSREELEKPKTDDDKKEHFQQHKMWYGER